jgi:hypothetical protein
MRKLAVLIIAILFVIMGFYLYFKYQKYQQDLRALVISVDQKISFLDAGACDFLPYYNSTEFRCYADKQELCSLNKLKFNELLIFQKKLENEINKCIELQ